MLCVLDSGEKWLTINQVLDRSKFVHIQRGCDLKSRQKMEQLRIRFFWHALLEPKIQQQRVSWTFFCCTSKVLAANLPMLVVHWTLSHAGAGVPEEVGPEEPHPKGWE